MKDFYLRWRAVLIRLSMIPVAFLGVGLYRAWLATFFRYGAYPNMGFLDYALFEAAIGIASFAAAFFAPKITPLWSNKAALRLTLISMASGSALCALGSFCEPLLAAKYLGLVAAGAGLALLILMWAEFYGSINPMRVAVYHAASIFLGELLCWMLMGMQGPYVVALSLILPFVAVYWIYLSMKRLPEVERPKQMNRTKSHAIPWKPIMLMAVCTFATGFGTLPDQPLSFGNVFGVLTVTALVFFGVLSTSKWFNFDTIYRLAFPLTTIALLLIAPSLSTNPAITAACFDAGYTMLSMFIMIVLSNLTYRFGINAVWLNGIERGIRYVVEAAGWILFSVTSSMLAQGANTMVHYAITIAVVIAFAVIAFAERGLSARWGIDLHAEDDDEVFAPGVLALRVTDLAKEHNLSQREEEVLQLLARKETVAQIEENLFVAQGTIKAHTSRIYRKLGIHSKEELYELLGITDD